MSFTFSARTVLELGKELISSDEVAIYELIKNAVDASSPRVEIVVSVLLRNSDYKDAIAQIEEERKSPSEVTRFIRSKLIDVDNTNSHTLLDRLGNNVGTKDFLKTLASLYDTFNYIEIRDTGHGMSLDDLSKVFLRIGTNSRRKENLRGARNLGDKGIGRLSTMRLGDCLRVKTSRNNDTYWNLLSVDWTLFSRDEDIDADSIIVAPELGNKKATAKEHGTNIRISALLADWDLPRFADILQGKIARMVDPFVRGGANRLIVARHNGKRVSVPSIPGSLLRTAHAVCHVEFQMDGKTPVLEGEINYRYRHRKSIINARGSEINSLIQETIKRRAKRGHAAFNLVPLRPSALRDLGNFSCDIYWFNRKVVEAVEGLTSKPTETRAAISQWSGGPMLYRYGFRILPYGDPKDDWLALDELAFSSSGFKLNRQQVIGRVHVQTPHMSLREQTNREGLVTSDTFSALRSILLWVVHTEMRGLINEADEIEFVQRRDAEQDTMKLSKAMKRVDVNMNRLRSRLGDAAGAKMDNLTNSVESLAVQSQRLIDRIEGLIDTKAERDKKSLSNAMKRVDVNMDRLRKQLGDTVCTEMDSLSNNVERLTAHSRSFVDRIRAVVDEADEERGKFVYLAGIGLMTEFIFHELDRAVAYTIEAISHGAIRETTMDSLREQLTTLHKRIAAFDELTSERRQRKSNFDLVQLVGQILDNHAREFERHVMAVEFIHPQHSFEIKAVRGMVIQILENLIVNAAYWLKQQKRFERNFKPSLSLVLDVETKSLHVEDNGPGVIPDRIERIFQPFITTKPTGQGRGLGLYIARDLAEYHGWKLHMDPEIGRIREGRTNMFVLEMR